MSHAAPAGHFAAFSPAPADPARRAKLVAVTPALDAFFASKLKETGATGLAVGIILEGELVYQRGFGVRDVATAAPVDSDTVFRIASMTKSFTALSVMNLRDQGRVQLDEPVATYVSELRALVAPTRDAPPISLRLLLTNASGLAYDDLWGAVTFGKSDDELMTLLRGGVQISTTPGTRYAYSNLGWALLGKVVERVSGMRYRDYVTESILRPLGMSSTVWEATDVSPARLATGYYRVGDDLVPEPRPSDGVFEPAGGLYLHGSFRVACQRGAITFDVLLSPAIPPRVQNADITEELPLDERTERAARMLAAAMADADDNESFRREFLAPTADHGQTKRILGRLGSAHGPCSVERGWLQIYRGPLEVERNAQYVLRCNSGPLELTLDIDEKTGRVKTFSAHQPRTFDATCWQ